VDPSGGRRDQFTVAIAHRSHDKAVVDLVKAWKPPFNPEQITEECAKTPKPIVSGRLRMEIRKMSESELEKAVKEEIERLSGYDAWRKKRWV
jgi:hypothetical protein